MKKFFLFSLIILVIACQENPEKKPQMSEEKIPSSLSLPLKKLDE